MLMLEQITSYYLLLSLLLLLSIKSESGLKTKKKSLYAYKLAIFQPQNIPLRKNKELKTQYNAPFSL